MPGMDKSTIIIGVLTLMFGVLTAVAGGVLWLGVKIGSLETAVERNTSAIAELRTEVKDGDAELRSLILLHISGHQHGIADADVGDKNNKAE